MSHTDLDLDRPAEECGVVGISTPREDAAQLAFFGLYALQHRGQEAAGIAVADRRAVRVHKALGLVSQVFEAGTLDPPTVRKPRQRSPRPPDTGQTISRIDAAGILRIKPKTLANRAKNLPKPIARIGRAVPVYDYAELRAALVKLYPAKAFLLPERLPD